MFAPDRQPMKIALHNVSDERWIGGVYYVINLLRALVKHGQDDGLKLVIVGSRTVLQDHYGGFKERVDFIPFPPSRGKSLSWKLAYTISHFQEFVSSKLSRDENVSRGYLTHLTRRLGRILRDQEVAVLFPGLSSLGVDFGIPWVGWIFDFQHRYYPEFFSEAESLARDEAFVRLGKEAKLVVTSSEEAHKDFRRFLPEYSHKVRVLKFRSVLPDGWDAPDPARTAHELGLADRFLMIPNQFYVHKNHRTAFEAARILRDRGRDIHLVCTGALLDSRKSRHAEELQAYVSANGLENRIHVLGLLPRLQQIQLLRRAAAIIQPSLFEGWSTVVEDCRTLGKKVFLSDIPVHREQNPPHNSYFAPLDAEMLANRIAEQWNELSPGPSLGDEIEATPIQQELIKDYAADFLRIAAEGAGLDDSQ
jgi:glycosyltransferase involved in cell wall biosynthesis